MSPEIKQRIAEKSYDPKRSCYVPHPEEKFCEGLIEETVGNKVKVKITMGVSAGETKEYKQDLVTQVSILVSTRSIRFPAGRYFIYVWIKTIEAYGGNMSSFSQCT